LKTNIILIYLVLLRSYQEFKLKMLVSVALRVWRVAISVLGAEKQRQQQILKTVLLSPVVLFVFGMITNVVDVIPTTGRRGKIYRELPAQSGLEDKGLCRK
jgi:hypothetical protein